MSDFLVLMTFCASLLALVFNALSQVYIGEFSLLSIFMSLLLFKVFLWFLGRYLGISIDTTLQYSADQLRENVGNRASEAYNNSMEKFQDFRYRSQQKRLVRIADKRRKEG